MFASLSAFLLFLQRWENISFVVVQATYKYKVHQEHLESARKLLPLNEQQIKHTLILSHAQYVSDHNGKKIRQLIPGSGSGFGWLPIFTGQFLGLGKIFTKIRSVGFM